MIFTTITYNSTGEFHLNSEFNNFIQHTLSLYIYTFALQGGSPSHPQPPLTPLHYHQILHHTCSVCRWQDISDIKCLYQSCLRAPTCARIIRRGSCNAQVNTSLRHYCSTLADISGKMVKVNPLEAVWMRYSIELRQKKYWTLIWGEYQRSLKRGTCCWKCKLMTDLGLENVRSYNVINI